MEHLEGETAAKRAKLSAGGSEDCLSDLPDDVLLHILRDLGTTAAASRTSVLSSRWLRLWALLPDLHFFWDANPDSVRGALAALEAMSDDETPPLRNLVVFLSHASPDSLAAWLPIAASPAFSPLSTWRRRTMRGRTEEAPLSCPASREPLPCCST
ncbi:hypothetical protein ACQ4PT_058124 [Festuca glaucescens]